MKAKSDETHGRDNDDETKKRPFKCCVCRSTREHRCYKCFCWKCPAFTKKIPPRLGMNNRFSGSRPSNSSSVSHINEEITASGTKKTTDTSAKQRSFETSDPSTGDKRPPGFPFKAILPNSLAGSGLTGQPSIVKEPSGNDKVGDQKLTNQDSVTSKSHAGTTSIWDILSAKKPKASGNQVGWANGAGEVSSWGAWPVKEPRASGDKGGWANRAGTGRSWSSGAVNASRSNSRRSFPNRHPRRVSEPRGNQSGWANRDGYVSRQDSRKGEELRGNKEVMADRAQDESSRLTSCSERRSIRGNPEVKLDRAGDGSSKQVINNRIAQSGSCEDSLTVKEPSGNQEMMGCTENVFSAATEPAGYSNFGEGSVQDCKDDATNVSKSIKGVTKANRKIIDPAVSSPQLAKPPRIVVSGESSSSLKKKVYSSQKFDKVRPASQIIWKGNFEFLDFSDDKRLCEGYLAHTAARVNNKVYKFISEFSGNLQFKIHPRRAFMPEIFKLKHPDDRDIALYFYPQRYKRSIKEYGELLQLLVQHDLMSRSVMGQVELLVFSSRLLHSDFQKLEGRRYYLWGVFRQIGKENVGCSAKVLQITQLAKVCDEGICAGPCQCCMHTNICS